MGRKAHYPPPIYPKNAQPGERTFARVYVAGKPHDYVLGPAGSDQAKQAYARLLAHMQTNAGLPPSGPSGQQTVAEVLARFRVHAEAEYGPAARELENFRRALAPLLRLYGDTSAANFDTDALAVVQRAMASGSWMNEAEKAAAAKRGRPIAWCRNVVNRHVVRIKTCWKWAESKKLVPAGSYHHLQTLRGLTKKSRDVRHTKPRQPSTRAQIEAIVPHCPRPVAAMLDLQWWSGMRSCEVRIMRSCDIERSGDVWLYRPSQHKNDWREDEQPRVIPLGPECQKILARWLRPDDPQAYLFRSRRGGNHAYTRSTYPQAVARACKKAGVRTVPYGCRHAAKMRIARVAGAEAARTVLGHKSIETTALYGGLDTDLAADTMRDCG